MAGVLIETVQRRILWFSVLAVLFTGLIVAAVTIVPLGATLRAATAQRLEHVGAVKALTASQVAGHMTGVAMQVTSRTIIRRELEAYNRGERTADELRAFTIDKIADAMTLAPGVVGITRLGRDGTVLVSVGEVIEASVLERAGADIARRLADDGAATLLGPFATTDGSLRLAAGAAIVSRSGGHEGTDVVLFAADGIGPVLTPQGSEQAEVTTYLGARATDGGTAWFTVGEEGLVRGIPPDPDSGWSLAAQTVRPGDWTLIAATPTDALYREVDTVIAVAAIAVAALLACGVLALLVLLRPLAGHALITTRELEEQVHELQGLRHELEEERQRLQDSNGELEQFAYAASHDMRQPLRMVISFLDLLRRRNAGVLDGESQSYIQEAVDGARRLNAMIEGLLEYSRVGRLEDALTQVDLNGVLARAEANLGKMLDDSGAEVEQGPLPTVMGHDGQLVSLFQNLIENAVKYRAADRPPRIRISATVGAHGLWTIRVADNGRGMDPTQAPRALQLFQRLHGTGGSAPEGTGLGLALCNKIVTRHGGSITLETAEDQGTTVVFTLPAAPQQTAARPAVERQRDLAAL